MAGLDSVSIGKSQEWDAPANLGYATYRLRWAGMRVGLAPWGCPANRSRFGRPSVRSYNSFGFPDERTDTCPDRESHSSHQYVREVLSRKRALHCSASPCCWISSRDPRLVDPHSRTTNRFVDRKAAKMIDKPICRSWMSDNRSIRNCAIGVRCQLLTSTFSGRAGISPRSTRRTWRVSISWVGARTPTRAPSLAMKPFMNSISVRRSFSMSCAIDGR